MSVAEVVELVKTYAKQETLGPLRGAGRWIAMGLAGALLLALGLILLILGVLRLIQTEWDRAATGSTSWLAYLFALVLCVVFIVLAISRIKRDRLNEEPK